MNPPSKQFIIRGSIAIGLLTILLVSQSNWFKKLLNKENAAEEIKTVETVGDLIVKDSNNNTIPDWEERLWGLDPTISATNGVSNKIIIEEKKKSLGVDDQAAPQDETEALAQQLFTVASALGQTGDASKENLQGIAKKMAESVDIEAIPKAYSIENLKIVPTTRDSLVAYYRNMSLISSKQADPAEIDLVIQALEQENFTDLKSLGDAKIAYENYARALTQVPVPVAITQLHLDVVNGLAGVADSFEYLMQLSDNSVNALAGVAAYKEYSTLTNDALFKLHDYFIQYGILDE